MSNDHKKLADALKQSRLLQDARRRRHEAEEENGREWIPVTERVPKPHPTTHYLVFDYTGVIRFMTRCDGGWEECEAFFYGDKDITHWMPLPAPPTDGK